MLEDNHFSFAPPKSSVDEVKCKRPTKELKKNVYSCLLCFLEFGEAGEAKGKGSGGIWLRHLSWLVSANQIIPYIFPSRRMCFWDPRTRKQEPLTIYKTGNQHFSGLHMIFNSQGKGYYFMKKAKMTEYVFRMYKDDLLIIAIKECICSLSCRF